MQYESGDIVLFDGGPALIIGRDTEERTYLVEFTGLTGKRTKTVTDRDIEDAPREWHISNHLDLVHEVMALRKEVKELQDAHDALTAELEKKAIPEKVMKAFEVAKAAGGIAWQDASCELYFEIAEWFESLNPTPPPNITDGEIHDIPF
jgi:hypothetical protein